MINEAAVVKAFEVAQDQLVTQSTDFPLIVIKQMVESENLDLSPHYQRRDRWDRIKQSQLIESFLLNVPVPPIYLAEDLYGDYSVIDGKQRLTAGVDYIQDQFKLTGLERFKELNGLKYSELPRPLQNAIYTRPYLRFITLLKQSDSLLKYEVFTRLNRGGERLSDQEVRNAAYSGSFNDAIYELANDPFLRERLKIKDNNSAKYKEMTDAAFVLRYFTLVNNWEVFNGDLAESMNATMRERRNANEKQIKDFKADFNRSLNGCQEIFGDHAFQRYMPNEGKWREQTISGLYDAQMIAVHYLNDLEIQVLSENSSSIIEQLIELFVTEKVAGKKFAGFEDAIRLQTNTPSKVRLRINAMQELLKMGA